MGIFGILHLCPKEVMFHTEKDSQSSQPSVHFGLKVNFRHGVTKTPHFQKYSKIQYILLLLQGQFLNTYLEVEICEAETFSYQFNHFLGHMGLKNLKTLFFHSKRSKFDPKSMLNLA